MTRVLQINASLHGADAQSSRLASEFVAALQRGPGPAGANGVAVTVREHLDLREQIGHGETGTP